jgi:AAA ATPase domain
MRRNNPYRPQPGGDPPLLVGRGAEVQTVETTLVSAREGGPMRPSVFLGLRGMGKTALLRHCAALAREDGAVVVSIEATSDVSMAGALAEGIADAKRQVSVGARIRDAVDSVRRALPNAAYDLPNDMGKIELDLRGGETQQPLRRALEDLNEAARRRDSYLVLAIDEIQEADVNELRDIIMFIHATAGTTKPAVLIGAGLTNSAEHLHDARTYTERWRFPRLECLNEQDTRDAIAVPARKQGVEFSEGALKLLVTETGGYPFFIQEYASVLWTYTDGSIIEVGDVRDRIAGIRKDLDEQFYALRFARLTNRECAYALAVASLGSGPQPVHRVAELFDMKSSDLSSVRNQLIKKEVLFAEAPGTVEFRMPLTEQYIERNRAALEARANGSTLSSPTRRTR